jgi:DNA-binding CsgD family transcriptional regulator
MVAAGTGEVVGRAHEVGLVRTLLERATTGIAFVGHAGAGKSRLAHLTREFAEEMGFAIAVATATPVAAGLTLGALAHLLPPAGELATVHADLQPTQLLQAARLTLDELAEGRRLCLLVDDAHHLDAVSAHLLHQLAATGGVFIVLTVRLGEPTDPAVVAMWKDRLIERLDIGPLGFDDTARLAAGVLGGALDAEAAGWLWRTSGGNPLYARELVAGAAERGGLEHRGGQWHLTGRAERVSPRLADLVGQRLVGLTPAQRRALDLVALAEPIGLDLAQQIVGVDALFELDELGLLTVTTAGYRAELRPGHPLFGEALRHQPMTLRRRADLQALVAAVEALGARRRDDPVRIAGWQLAAGGAADAGVLLRAAIAAQLGFDDHTAVRLATTALEQGPADDGVRRELHLTLATSLGRLGRFPEAAAQLAVVSEQAVDDAQLARVAMRRVMLLAEGADDIPAARRAGLDAIGALADSEWATDVRCVVATMEADFGRIADAVATLSQAPTTGVGPRSHSTRLLAGTAVLQGQGHWGRCADAASEGYRFQLDHSDEDSTFHPMSQYVYRFHVFTRCGRLDEADEGLALMLAEFTNSPRPVGSVVTRLMTGRVNLARGRFTDALAHFTEAARQLTPAMQPYLHRWARTLVQWSHAATGATIDDPLDDIPTAPRAGVGFGGSDVTIGRVAALQARGRGEDAHRELRAAIEAARADHDTGSLLDLLGEACLRFGDTAAAGALGALARDLDDGRSPLLPVQARLADAVREGRPDAWADVAQRYATLGMWFDAARAAAAGAALAGDQGDRRRAVGLANDARRALARCQGGILPGLALGESGARLTPREYDIARMVAGGQSSKEVAAALVLSVRTVDNHLQRIYGKLGVTSRAELAAALAGA